jgi:hypothetical protein
MSESVCYQKLMPERDRVCRKILVPTSNFNVLSYARLRSKGAERSRCSDAIPCRRARAAEPGLSGFEDYKLVAVADEDALKDCCRQYAIFAGLARCAY